MARAFSLALKSYLSGSIISWANCIKITRLDGRQLGFTSLDQDVTIEGLLYESYTSADMSEMAAQIGSGVDNLNLVGLISSTKVKESELLAGLFDGARCEIFAYPFDNPSLGKLGPLLTGTIGEITSDGGQFTAEVRSLSQRLSQQFVELTSPLCRVRELFDRRCMPLGYNEGVNVDLPTGTITPAGCRVSRTVTQVDSATVIRFGSEPAGSGLYRHGKATVTSGSNQGVAREIKEHVITSPSIAIITLQEPYPFLVSVGDVAVLEWGCNRAFIECHGRFGNTHNFQGEPNLPGNVALTKRGQHK